MNKTCYRLRKDIQCLVWLYDTSSKLESGNLSKYLKFMPSLVTSVKEIHAAIPIIPIISTWWKMGSKGTLIRETSGKNTWIGGHWKMWPPVSCLFVLHSPLSHSSHRVTSKIITVSSFSTLCIHVSLTKGVFRKEFHISENILPSFEHIHKCRWNFYNLAMRDVHLDGGRVSDVPLKKPALEGAEGQALPQADHHQVDVAETRKLC